MPSISTAIAADLKTRRVDERDAQAVEVDAISDQIACRTRNVGHDGTRRAGERIEDARLTHVRPADDRDLEALAHEPPPGAVGQQFRRPVRRSSIAPANTPCSMK